MFSKDEISEYTVTTELTNPYKVPIQLRLYDRAPLVADKNVEIQLVRSEPPATFDEKTGNLEWRPQLPPGSKLSTKFVYTLKRPKGYRLRAVAVLTGVHHDDDEQDESMVLSTGVCWAGLLWTAFALSHPVRRSDQQVVVYPDRAQVTRTAQVACGGQSADAFASLPPAADVQSVRAAIDVAGAQVLGLRTETEVLRSPFAAVEQIDEEIRQIDDRAAPVWRKARRERSVEAVATRYEDVAVAMLGRNWSIRREILGGGPAEGVVARGRRAAEASAGTRGGAAQVEKRRASCKETRRAGEPSATSFGGVGSEPATR